MATVPPAGDANFKDFCVAFSSLYTIQPTVYGGTSSDATQLASLVTAYSSALAVSTLGTTRTKGTIAAKDTAKNALRAKLMELVKVINATVSITPQQRIDLGLLPKDSIPTPVPVPASAPQVEVDAQGVLRLHDSATPSRKGKPAGVKGAVIFTKVLPVGTDGPTTPVDANFTMLATKSRVPLPLPSDADAKKLYVMAQWYNERGELGPVSNVAVTTVAA